jgi:hypothetical protein
MRPITKEGIEVQVGQVWRDLDKRGYGRVVKVMDVWPGRGKYSGEWFASVRPTSLHAPDRTYNRASKLRISRMHKHSTGFELIR